MRDPGTDNWRVEPFLDYVSGTRSENECSKRHVLISKIGLELAWGKLSPDTQR